MEEFNDLVQDEALRTKIVAIAQQKIDSAVKAKAEAFEGVLKDNGFAKPDGKSGTQFLAETIAQTKAKLAEAETVRTKLAEYEQKAPEYANLEKKFSGTIAELQAKLTAKESEIGTIRTGFLADSAVLGLGLKDEKAQKLAKLAISEAREKYDFQEKDGALLLIDKATKVQAYTSDAKPLTLGIHLANELKPFLTPETPPAPPKQPTTPSISAKDFSPEIAAQFNNLRTAQDFENYRRHVSKK
jgi:hypothetical protein